MYTHSYLLPGFKPRNYVKNYNMSDTYILIHTVWSTNKQKLQLTPAIRPVVFSHIVENAQKRSIEIVYINGYADHLHLLIRLHPTQNLAQVIHNIKGESSNWINSQHLTTDHFEWQEGYSAISISPSKKRIVKKLFVNHESKHEKMSFLQEVKLLKKDLLD